MKFQLKKYIGVMTHDTNEYEKFEEKPICFFQKWQEFGEFWSEHTKDSNICTLIGPFRAKYYNVWPKKVQRSYLFFWHWRVMQNLKKNWLMVWKMTERICKIFTRTLESIRIGYFMGYFFQVENAWAKILQRSYV